MDHNFSHWLLKSFFTASIYTIFMVLHYCAKQELPVLSWTCISSNLSNAWFTYIYTHTHPRAWWLTRYKSKVEHLCIQRNDPISYFKETGEKSKRSRTGTLSPHKHSTIYKILTICFLYLLVIANRAQTVVWTPHFPSCLKSIQ